MNSEYKEHPDDLEGQLATLTIVEPSKEYSNFANSLSVTGAASNWQSWKLVTGVPAAIVLSIGIIFSINSNYWSENLSSGPSTSLNLAIEDESISSPQIEQEPPYLLGVHYTETSEVSLIDSKPLTDIAVFFSYPCFPCYEFNDVLNEWLAADSSDISVSYFPVTWSETNLHFAKVFYTSEMLGMELNAHQQLFDALHKGNQALIDVPSLVRFFVSMGVPGDRFVAAFNSATTVDRVRDAIRFNQEFAIQSAPILIVDCHYRISPNDSVDQQDMLKVAKYLIDSKRTQDERSC